MPTFHISFSVCVLTLLEFSIDELFVLALEWMKITINGILSPFQHHISLIYWGFLHTNDLGAVHYIGYIWHMSVTINETISNRLLHSPYLSLRFMNSFCGGEWSIYKNKCHDWYTFQNVNHKINMNNTQERLVYYCLVSRLIMQRYQLLRWIREYGAHIDFTCHMQTLTATVTGTYAKINRNIEIALMISVFNVNVNIQFKFRLSTDWGVITVD